MKKNFLAALALFFSMTLVVACNTPSNESTPAEEPASSVPAEKSSTKHTHKYGEWTITKEATCEGKGEQERVCDCGEKQTKEIDALGHDWNDGVVTTAATCSTPGVMTFTCNRCQATKTEAIKADHVWGEATPVTGGDGEVDYNLFTCTVCNTAKKIEFVAKNSKATVNGSLKSDSQFPDYLKLSNNGDSVSYVFNSTVSGNAVIYMRGVMDYWHDGNNENQARNFFSGKNSQDGNFELKVNDAVVDYSDTKNLTYEDMLPGEAQGSYSPLGDAKVGACEIVSGQNTVVFKRTESYNMLIKDFVIIIG